MPEAAIQALDFLPRLQLHVFPKRVSSLSAAVFSNHTTLQILQFDSLVYNRKNLPDARL